MGANITREEAAARAAVIVWTPTRSTWTCAASAGAPTFHSTTTVRFTSPAPGAATWIDLIADEVLGAELNGAAVDVGV